MAERLQTGDVAEIELANGCRAYVQLVGQTYIVNDIPVANMVRVLPGVYSSPLPDEKIECLVDHECAFFSQVSLRGMLKWGVVRGRWSLPERESAVPDRRMWGGSGPDCPRGWKVVTTDRQLFTEREYAELHPEVDQAMLPLSEIPVPARLRWLIEVGWTPREVKSRRADWWHGEGFHPSLSPDQIVL